jgi:hypothetical protein
MATLQQIQDFIYVNDPTVQSWEQKAFDRWVAFYHSEGFICVVKNAFEDIVGVALVRPIMEPMDALDYLKFDQEGKGLHIQEIVCTAKGALIMLGFAVLQRFGMRQFVSWENRGLGKLMVRQATAVRRNIFRKMEAVYGE